MGGMCACMRACVHSCVWCVCVCMCVCVCARAYVCIIHSQQKYLADHLSAQLQRPPELNLKQAGARVTAREKGIQREEGHTGRGGAHREGRGTQGGEGHVWRENSVTAYPQCIVTHDGI